jgi:4-diphosphocytidyl-2-C-methyl-D-erythritol kinase
VTRQLEGRVAAGVDSCLSRVTLPAFCKVNLWLEIVGRRNDGFHELVTIFQSLDLADSLEIERADEAGLHLSVEGNPSLSAGRDNLVLRAGDLFMEHLGQTEGLRFRLEKRIPVGGGLGGGSSNAAVTLLGLNRLFGHPFTISELAVMGAALGSDVVFFLTGGSAVGTGRGDRIRALGEIPLPEAFLLIWPEFQISTREVYTLIEAPDVAEADKLTDAQVGTKIRQFLEVAGEHRWMALRNDLEGPVLVRYPALARLKETLSRSGCPGVLLAGSGSTMIAMGDRTVLTRVADECLSEKFGRVFLCQGIGRAEYVRRLGLEDGFDSGPH